MVNSQINAKVDILPFSVLSTYKNNICKFLHTHPLSSQLLQLLDDLLSFLSSQHWQRLTNKSVLPLVLPVGLAILAGARTASPHPVLPGPPTTVTLPARTSTAVGRVVLQGDMWGAFVCLLLPGTGRVYRQNM